MLACIVRKYGSHQHTSISTGSNGSGSNKQTCSKLSSSLLQVCTLRLVADMPYALLQTGTDAQPRMALLPSLADQLPL
jgi:hypothetical protein